MPQLVEGWHEGEATRTAARGEIRATAEVKSRIISSTVGWNSIWQPVQASSR